MFVKKIRKFFFSMEFWKIFLFSPISLKIGSFIVQDKYICVIFEFSDFAQQWWKKIRFKFEIWKIVVQKYPVGEALFWEKNIGFSFKKINPTFGKSGIWNIGNSENTSLARAVASLARTGNTCKYFGTLKSRSPEIQYFGSLVNRKFGNSKHRKIGGSEKRKFRKSESQKERVS